MEIISLYKYDYIDLSKRLASLLEYKTSALVRKMSLPSRCLLPFLWTVSMSIVSKIGRLVHTRQVYLVSKTNKLLNHTMRVKKLDAL